MNTTTLRTDHAGRRYWIEDGRRVDLVPATTYDLGPIAGRLLFDFGVYADMADLDSMLGPVPDGTFRRTWRRHVDEVLAGTGYDPASFLDAVRRRTSSRWTHAVGLDDVLELAIGGE